MAANSAHAAVRLSTSFMTATGLKSDVRVMYVVLNVLELLDD